MGCKPSDKLHYSATFSNNYLSNKDVYNLPFYFEGCKVLNTNLATASLPSDLNIWEYLTMGGNSNASLRYRRGDFHFYPSLLPLLKTIFQKASHPPGMRNELWKLSTVTPPFVPYFEPVGLVRMAIPSPAPLFTLGYECRLCAVN
jgi:hypothetical protein